MHEGFGRKAPPASRGGRLLKRFALATSLAALSLTASASPAGAATEIGSTFNPGTSYCGNLLLQSISPPADPYAAPSAGVITAWSYEASEVPVQIQLKVGRPAGTNQFTIVGESAVETALSIPLNSFPARVPVQAGDVIGIRPVTIGLPCIRGMAPGYSYSAYVMGNDVPPGTAATFNPPVADIQLDVAANVEPDADSDGFGDETQDRCLGVPGPTGGCPRNDFAFGKVSRNKTTGTALLTVKAPNPGQLALSGDGLKSASAAVNAPGDVKLAIRPKKKKKRELNETGKVKVKPRITYTPTGGNPKTRSIKVKLKKKL